MGRISSVGSGNREWNKFRNKYLRELDDPYSCSVVGCDVTIADKKGQLDHLIVRTGHFVHIKYDPENVRWTCGNHNDIENLSLVNRLRAIRRMWGIEAYEYAHDQASRHCK